MRFNKLDLNLLVALDALLSERSVTRAAQTLHLSQPATSGVLSRLREYFKDELLIPVGRQMVLTPMAKELSASVRDVLLRIQSTIAVQPDFDPSDSQRHFRVMASDYPISVVLAEAARRMHREAPGITLEIVIPGDTVTEAVERGEVDLLIVPSQYLVGSHPSEALCEETYTCVVWTENDQVGVTLTQEQYMGLGHVATFFGNKGHHSLEEWFLKSTSRTRRIEVTTNNFNTLPLLVVGTHRVATMHTRMAEISTRTLPVRTVPLPFDFPQMVWSLQWPRHLSQDAGHTWFRQLIKESVQGTRSAC